MDHIVIPDFVDKKEEKEELKSPEALVEEAKQKEEKVKKRPKKNLYIMDDDDEEDEEEEPVEPEEKVELLHQEFMDPDLLDNLKMALTTNKSKEKERQKKKKKKKFPQRGGMEGIYSEFKPNKEKDVMPFGEPNVKAYRTTVTGMIEDNDIDSLESYLKRYPTDLKITAPFKISPLHHCARHNFLHMAKFLVKQGADPHAFNQWHQTPLFVACWWGVLPMVEYFLSLGCDCEVEDSKGRNCMMVVGAAGKHKVTVENKEKIETLLKGKGSEWHPGSLWFPRNYFPKGYDPNMFLAKKENAGGEEEENVNVKLAVHDKEQEISSPTTSVSFLKTVISS